MIWQSDSWRPFKQLPYISASERNPGAGVNKNMIKYQKNSDYLKYCPKNGQFFTNFLIFAIPIRCARDIFRSF